MLTLNLYQCNPALLGPSTHFLSRHKGFLPKRIPPYEYLMCNTKKYVEMQFPIRALKTAQKLSVCNDGIVIVTQER